MRSPASRPRDAVPLDDIDKAIIRELQLDGRVPYAKLGPAVGLSQTAARQRVQRLIDAGVMQIVAVTDPLSLGFSLQAMVGIRASGDLRRVAEQLSELSAVEYVVITSGGYDLLVEVVCEGTDELFTLLNDHIRTIEGVTGAEAFTYLQLQKQSYSWGTR